MNLSRAIVSGLAASFVAGLAAAEPFAIFEIPVTNPPPPAAFVPGDVFDSGGMEFAVEPGPFGPSVTQMGLAFSWNGTSVVNLNNNVVRVLAPLPAELMRYEFRYQGGEWYIEVNGDRVGGNGTLTSIIGPGVIVGGAEVNVISVLSAGQEIGYVRIRGPISDMSVFGQELQVDDFQLPCPAADSRPTADINGDGIFDLFDILRFFDLFADGI